MNIKQTVFMKNLGFRSLFQSKIYKRIQYILAPCIFILFTNPLIASEADQTIPQFLLGEITEEYSFEINTAGPLLVGFWMGNTKGHFNPRELRVLVPTGPKSSTICFSATTRDGVYTASGHLHAPSDQVGEHYIKDYNNSPYLSQLRDYLVVDFAPLISLGDGQCNSNSDNVLVPSVVTSPEGVLTVALNSRGSEIISITIEERGTLAIAGDCSTDSARRNVGFDTLCLLPLPKNKDKRDISHTISVIRKPRVGPLRIEDFHVRY